MSQAPQSTVEFVADFAPARRPLWHMLMAGALLALTAIVATLQAPYRDAYGYGARGLVDWLIRPLEINPELRLPRVEGDLIDIAFAADGKTGFVLGTGGAIVTTGDAGLTWRVSRKPGLSLLRAIGISGDGTKAVAVGDGEILLADGADAPWRRADLAIPDFADARFHAVQVSDDGRRLRIMSLAGLSEKRPSFVSSNDGGGQWTISEAPTSSATVMAFDETGRIGWIGARSGEIARTADGGATWSFGYTAKDLLPPGAGSGDAADAGVAIGGPMLGAMLLAPLPEKSEPSAASGDKQYPVRTTQGTPDGESNGAAAPAKEIPAVESVPPPRRTPVRTRTPTSSRASSAPSKPPDAKPKVDSQQNDAAEQELLESIVLPLSPPVVALATVPKTDEVAGIRALGESSEVFVGGKAYRLKNELVDIAMADAITGWAVGSGEIWATDNGGTWTNQFLRGGSFDAIAAARDGRRAWAVGSDGVLVATVDGGAHWFLQFQRPGPDPSGTYWRFPAPWFYLALIGFGGFLAYARRPLPAEQQPGVSAMGSTDAPAATLADDKLQFAPLARGISRYLRNRNTQPPLTLAISGEWGSGKSSLMRMVCEDLRDHGNHPVWFNAWHHQDEEQLLAALLAAIRDKALPPWLSLDGLQFRLKLFLIRARRKLVATLALVAIASFLIAVLRYTSGADWARWTESMAGLFPGKDGAETAGLGTRVIQGLTGLAGLAGLITTVTGISRALQAFGANPAVLLTSTIDNFKLRDAAAQVHFRTRFQRQFDDVTEALPYPLVIVIDDLDRCRPETVLQVMESVNFLMTSGKCFVLFGMSTPRVQAALALSFKDIAQEFVEIDPDIETPATPEDRIQAERVNRLNYAGDYLQKLINLDIRVPAREDIAPHLLLTRSRLPESDERFEAGRRWFALLWPLALVVAVAGAAWWEGSQLFAPDPREQVAEQAPPRPLAGPAAATTAATDPRPAEPAPIPATTNSPASKPVEVIPGQSGDRGWPTIVLLGGLLLVLGVWQYRRRNTDEAVVDTDAFCEALRVWTPIVARRTPSPRAIKRFGNRLRYLAMLQQAEDSGSDDGSMLPDWLLRRRAANDESGPPQPPPAKVDVVAEHRIVALGAIHAVFGDRDWREWLTRPRLPAGASPYDDVDKAISAYTASGWRWPPSGKELDAFERSLKGIRLRGDIDVLSDLNEPQQSPDLATSTTPGQQSRPRGAQSKQ